MELSTSAFLASEMQDRMRKVLDSFGIQVGIITADSVDDQPSQQSNTKTTEKIVRVRRWFVGVSANEETCQKIIELDRFNQFDKFDVEIFPGIQKAGPITSPTPNLTGRLIGIHRVLFVLTETICSELL